MAHKKPGSPQLKAGVMGWPVDHSLSPKVHGFWLRHYAINGTYERLAVASDDFAQRLRNLAQDGFVGVNITVPYKETALTVVDELDPLARRIGAVNTVQVRSDGSLFGFNTDGFGFLENLKSASGAFDAHLGPAVVLGAGGAARAVLVALLDAGAPEIWLVNRTRARADQLVADLTDQNHGERGLWERILKVGEWSRRGDYLDGAALLVNTTILGMTGQLPLDLDLTALPANAVVNDIVYVPLETDLLARARARGNRTVDGLGMLLHQARPGFAAWFGPLPVVNEALRTHVLAGL